MSLRKKAGLLFRIGALVFLLSACSPKTIIQEAAATQPTPTLQTAPMLQSTTALQIHGKDAVIREYNQNGIRYCTVQLAPGETYTAEDTQSVVEYLDQKREAEPLVFPVQPLAALNWKTNQTWSESVTCPRNNNYQLYSQGTGQRALEVSRISAITHIRTKDGYSASSLLGSEQGTHRIQETYTARVTGLGLTVDWPSGVGLVVTSNEKEASVTVENAQGNSLIYYRHTIPASAGPYSSGLKMSVRTDTSVTTGNYAYSITYTEWIQYADEPY